MSGPNKSRASSHFKRRRRRGSYLGVTGKYPSPQNEHSLFYESPRERDLFVALAFQRNVEVVEDHPFPIEYLVGSKRRRYTPDALVRYRPEQNGRREGEVFEVKVSWELERDPESYEAAFAAAKEHCDTLGFVFRVVTENDLPRPRVRNLRFLLPYRSYPADAAITFGIADLLRGGPMSLRRLCEEGAARGLVQEDLISQCWHLVATQEISVGLDTPLTMDSLLEAVPWAIQI